MKEYKTLILGLGNDILTDDGIGPRLVCDLAKTITRADIVFNTATCGGLETMENIRGYKKVIFIDAISTIDGRPGNVYYFTPSDFHETSNLSNLHDISFLTALRMGNILELDLPSDLHIIAIEIIEDRVFNDKLSPVIDENYPVILKKVTELVLQNID
jgi:hydrogenase maturation protease